jgi:hypothetical protein
MRNLLRFFENNNTKPSMIRLLCFIVTVCALPMLYVNPEQSIPVCGLIGAAIAGQWLTKGKDND